MKFTVDGTTTIGWSVLVEAKDEKTAEAIAQAYWEHNTTYEQVEVTAVYEGDLN